MFRKKHSVAEDLGLLALRVTAGSLLAGHGAQKLFGSFGGYGLEGTAGWLGSMGLKPPKAWAALAGASEFGGGLALALGALNPLGELALAAPMLMAWNKAHTGKPVWANAGGPELVWTNLAIAVAVGLIGPGRYSVDEALGIEVPDWAIGVVAAGVAAGVVIGVMAQPEPAPAEQDAARDELQTQGEVDQEQAVNS
jgi:putative oxidoreductase